MKNKILVLIILLTSSIFFLSFSQSAHASIIGDILNAVKNIFTPINTQQVIVTTEMKSLSDSSKNPTIKSGDSIEFTFTIDNTTNNNYKFAFLKTNLDTSNLYYIRNIRGAFSLDDQAKTITFPNLFIRAHQIIIISFDANIIQNLPNDIQFTLHPQVFTNKSERIADTGETKFTAKHFTKVNNQINSNNKVNASTN